MEAAEVFCFRNGWSNRSGKIQPGALNIHPTEADSQKHCVLNYSLHRENVSDLPEEIYALGIYLSTRRLP